MHKGMIILIKVRGNYCLRFCIGAGLSKLIDGDMVILMNIQGHNCLCYCIGAELS